MTLREFKFLIRWADSGQSSRAEMIRGWMTDEQRKEMRSQPFVDERNAKKRNMGFWQRMFIEQAWRIMYPGEPRK